MSRACQVTGARPGFGHSVSHSNRRTKRRFDVNVQRRHYWVPSLGRTVTLRVSPKGIRTIDKQGIDVVVAPTARPRREGLMAAKSKDVRPKMILESTAGTGFRYLTEKNRRNNPGRLRIRKYDPVARRHVELRETR